MKRASILQSRMSGAVATGDAIILRPDPAEYIEDVAAGRLAD